MIDVSNEDSDFKGECSIIFERSPMELSKEELICQVTEKSIKEVIGINSVFSAKPWWMDTQIFTESGIPTIALGPCGYGAHADEEYVNIKSVVKSAEIFQMKKV